MIDIFIRAVNLKRLFDLSGEEDGWGFSLPLLAFFTANTAHF